MKLNKKIIVLTGGIASGKSTVGKILQEKGYQVVESDKIVHKLYEKNSKVYKYLVEEFGNIIEGEKEINRKKLASIVYRDKSKIRKLNKIVHKYVVKELMAKAKIIDEEIVFLDIPLMIEEKERLENHGLIYDKIWLIESPVNLRLKRIVDRDNIGKKEAKKIIENQMKDLKKEEYADEIIKNNGNIDKLKEEIEKKLQILK